MRFYSIPAALCVLSLPVFAHADNLKARHERIAHKRQTTSPPPGSSGAAPPPGATPSSSGPPPPATFTALDTGTGIPPLSSITSGMPTQATLAPSVTFTPGASPPVSGAPPLPSRAPFVIADWPPVNVVPPGNSPEVTEWMKELDGHNIPDLSPTINGSCEDDPKAAADSASRGWWTCGGITRATDIVNCPDKLTWGISFDDGPSPYTRKLLKYLDEKDLKAMFFVVGSRILERPEILVEEYMAGHEISVHTWSHSKPLTSLTNAEVVAELGWTRKIIKDVLGVSPTTFRPPWGDIDDRVRAISMAMGMIPILWTSTPATGPFDTNDWKVAGGLVPGPASFDTFNAILGNASTMETGFIVLQHDLYEITVDLAIGYTLNAAQTHSPAFNVSTDSSVEVVRQS
ncbi:hypothetical protein HGRIS_010494 [Hohenbuehelia grisea]|uniref:chitin deacetylase n=1 Tax=Hohenbuehelia grisea TaxID=104357 RepID=A0ABR3IX16_9AGAR